MNTTPDPSTEEGRAEIQRRVRLRAEKDGAAAREHALYKPDEEPSGKMTQPNDIDRHRDRKGGD
jgi:hypothetical protein